MRLTLFVLLAACRRDAPVAVATPVVDLAEAARLPPSPVVELAGGWYSFAARLEDGRVFVWGHFLDAPGQSQPTPIELPLPGKPAAMAAAKGHAHFCFVIDGGAAVCRSRLPLLSARATRGSASARCPTPPSPGCDNLPRTSTTSAA